MLVFSGVDKVKGRDVSAEGLDDGKPTVAEFHVLQTQGPQMWEERGLPIFRYFKAIVWNAGETAPDFEVLNVWEVEGVGDCFKAPVVRVVFRPRMIKGRAEADGEGSYCGAVDGSEMSYAVVVESSTEVPNNEGCHG
jgi:hypothetical protein